MSASPKVPSICSSANFYHKQGITGKNVTVVIMDSGLSPHREIANNRILAFCDFVSGREMLYDDYSHGTHVAGIIGASTIGIAPETRLIPLKILDRHGNGSIDTLIEGIKWILAHRNQYDIRIVNLSVGMNPTTSPRQKSMLNLWVSRLWEAGLVVCCSAGNNGPAPDSITVPGNCPDVITVGSCDGRSFSSSGPKMQFKPELCAPGVHILSLKPGGGYHIKNGTSMSTPFISGFCALLLQLHPTLSNNEVKQRLIESATFLTTIPSNIQGAGAVCLDRLLGH